MEDIDLLTMGSRASDSHTGSKKHQIKLKERMKGLDLFFKGTVKPSSPRSSYYENFSSSKAVTNNIDELLSISARALNAEIYWVLKVVEGHFSYRSY